MLETIEYKQTLDSFYDYLFGVIKLHRDTIPKLKDELMLIQSNSIDELSDNLNHQQIFLYQIKNFDQEVAAYMEKLNVSGKNISEVINQFPEDQQDRFAKLLAEFKEVAKEIEFYKNKCQTLLQTKLHVVNKNIAQYKAKQEKTTYGEDGKNDSSIKIPSAFEKSI
ncbi:flagellar export chaperone FlgN [uncultured Acetobacterium sp.]|uniref:flagellar export chaperone FlgN n=1 Tax=uncultured Acetobacterium sp. TaxID=217139 RepID=UPI0025FACAD7|nr:flagellar export chaperone FlgN [uncultured Acetobacterium sp.]